MIQDTSKLIGKEYVFLEDADQKDSTVSFCKGMRFKIKKISGNTVEFKVISPVEECMPAIKKFAAILVRENKKEVVIFDKIIKLWTDEEKEFIIDPNNVWNKHAKQDGKRHSINVSYPVPSHHPDAVNGSPQSIYTEFYKHKGGKTNFYSYQAKKNEWYSKACYEFMRLERLQDIDAYEKLAPATVKDIHNSYYAKGFLSKFALSVKEFNKLKVKPV